MLTKFYSKFIKQVASIQNINKMISQQFSTINNSNTNKYADRILHLPLTVFTDFTNLAIKYNAVNLGQGFPDFEIADFVKDSCVKAIQSGSMNHQYTRMQGNLSFVQTLSEIYSPILGYNVDPATEIMVGNGATECLFAIVQGYINPGDEAIMIEPVYDSYVADVEMAGGICKYLPLKPSQQKNSKYWSLDLEKLESLITDKTKLLFLNTPHNPTGKIFSRKELEDISQIVLKHKNLFVVADEVYEFLVYGDNKFERISTMPGMRERTLSVSSIGKTFNCTGWKIGWVIGTKENISPVTMAHQWIPFCVTAPLQIASKLCFEHVKNTNFQYFKDIKNTLEKKRDIITNGLNKVGFDTIETDSGYFVLADFSKIKFPSEKFIGKTLDQKFCRWLTQEIGVTAIPNSAFYSETNAQIGSRFARFCFAKKNEILIEACKRLQKIQEFL